LAFEIIFVLASGYFAVDLGRAYFPLFYTVQTLVAASIVYLNRQWITLSAPRQPIPASLYVLGAWLLSVLFFGGLSELLEYIDPVKFEGASEKIGNYAVPRAALFYKIMIVSFTPITEEIIFRWGLLGLLLPRIGKAKALLASTFLFALVHAFAVPSQLTLVAIFVTGLLAGMVYLSFGLFWAIVFHVIANLMPTLNHEGLLDNTLVFVVLILLSVIGVGVFIVRTVRSIRGKSPA
jgi:membrane protease YdiL (CAAX protease family)